MEGKQKRAPKMRATSKMKPKYIYVYLYMWVESDSILEFHSPK